MGIPELKVKDEWETIYKLIETRCSIARYGDGENKLTAGRRCKPQEHKPKITSRLRDILVSNSEDCLIAIPNVFNGLPGQEGEKVHEYWHSVARKDAFNKYYDPQKQYYSSFITRPDNAPVINTIEYWELMKKLWEGEKVCIVQGEHGAFCKDPTFLEGADIVGDIRGPSAHAWKEYDSILSRCLKMPKGTVFVIGLGPTATVLAYDLSVKGYRALDLGHVGRFYRKFMESQRNV